MLLFLLVVLFLPVGSISRYPTPPGIEPRVHASMMESTGDTLIYLWDCGVRSATPALHSAIVSSGGTCAEQQTLEYIAWHESTGGRDIVNPTSSARGPYQYMIDTWTSRCVGDRFDPADSTACALDMIRNGESHNQWFAWW